MDTYMKYYCMKKTLLYLYKALITFSLLLSLLVLIDINNDSHYFIQEIDRLDIVNYQNIPCNINSKHSNPKNSEKQRHKNIGLWFMTNGSQRPNMADSYNGYNGHNRRRVVSNVWPEEDSSDRIVNQLMYVPKSENRGDLIKLKSILIYFGMGEWYPTHVKTGQEDFIDEKCPVNKCSITFDHKDFATADAVLFYGKFSQPSIHRPLNQIWMVYLLESPFHTQDFSYKKAINWTATYRRDSDIVTPYSKFVLYDSTVTKLPIQRNYAKGKSKKVAWFVSNCNPKNSRMQYALQLSRYIDVDVYGACGDNVCPSNKSSKCLNLLDTDYKFYLAFENSNCMDYITEKFFNNGLKHNVLPIVMGAQREEYEHVAPAHSFIHVEDFDSPRDLAAYLHLLHVNDTMYNEYFAWKGTGEFINDRFWCRVCALLHDTKRTKIYDNLEDWWRAPGICVHGSWKRSTCL